MIADQDITQKTITARPPAAKQRASMRTWVGGVATVFLVACSTMAGGVNAANVYGPPGVQPASIGGGVGGPYAAATGDFNKDGHPDVAIVKNNNNGTGGLAIYTSDAIGSLTLAHDYGIFNLVNPSAVVATDVNGDGKIDLVITDELGVSILLGVGDVTASFVAASPQRPDIPDLLYGAYSPVVADVNNDGRPDILMYFYANGNVYVGVLFGTGGGKFTLGYQYDIPQSGDIALAKVDADGVPDIVISTSSLVYVMKGIGQGLYQAPVQVLDVNSSAYLIDGTRVVDLDGDGKVDVVMANLEGNGVWLAKGNGDGTFQTPIHLYATGIPADGNRDMGRFIVADVNGDGLLDVVADGYVLLQQANHSFVFNQHIGYAETRMLTGIDLNGDGRADMITRGPGLSDIAVFRTQTGGAQQVLLGGAPQSTVFSTTFANPISVTVRDANNFAVPNVQVLFTVPFGVAQASATAFVATTDAQGKVSYTPVANNVLGCYQIHATVTGLALNLPFDMCNTGANDLSVLAASNNQTTLVSTAFSTPLQVQLSDANNVALQGVTVSFSAPSSGARALLSAASAITNASGIASVTATASAFSGAYSVIATAPGATPATIKLTNSAAAGSAAALAVDVNTPQYAYVNKPFSGPIIIHVTDFYGNAVQGATVAFVITPDAVTGATAVFSALTAVTNASGNAQVTATANGFIGQYSMKVSIPGSPIASPKTFALKNYAVLPAFMTLASGTPQTATVNTAFAQKLRVKVTDSGNAITPQVRVYFQASSGATLSKSSVLADAGGFAEVTATANSTVGSYQVGAIVYDTSTEAPITQLFSLTNIAAIPDFALTTTKSGTGSGTVTATGINCGADCNETFTQGTIVTLAAVPAAGALFTGWSGAGCSGTGTCSVTMSAAQTVNARFDLPPSVVALPVPALHPALLALLGLLTALSGFANRRRTR